MELGLSLGDDASNTTYRLYLDQKQQEMQSSIKNGGLGLKAQKSQENGPNGSHDNEGETQTSSVHELNLLPLIAPSVPRQISSHLQTLLRSSRNGSSENGPSGNNGLRAVAVVEEVSSENKTFELDLGMCRTTAGNGNPVSGGKKRGFEATENEVVEVERASDDDESGYNTRKKLRLSKDQSAFLDERFREHNTLNPKQKLVLAKQLNLSPRQVEVWFQNRRARTKLKQTEVECEYLKRCCEKLTEDNRRLQRELRDLRALNSSSNNPYHAQSLPATTLTMCPSCERVATTVAPPIVVSESAGTGKTGTTMAIINPLNVTRNNRPRFYPFSQTATYQNQPAAS